MPLARSALGALFAAAITAAAPLTAHAAQRDLLDVDDRQLRAVRAAAELAQARGGVDPRSFEGKDSTEGVYVRDSALAQEKFALAQRMERLKEWNKSADLYQEILEKYADRVVAAKVDKDQRIYQYISVTKGVQDALSSWPEEGRDVYRARYEAAAAALVESARLDDVVALNQVFSKYFITDAARQAGMRLIELSTERGEFLAAAEKGDRLLDRHPGAAVGAADRPALLFRTALAYHLAGDGDRAAQRLDRLKQESAQALGIVRGKEVVLAAALEAELKTPVGAALIGGDSYPMFGGDPSRSRISAARVSPGAKLRSVRLAPAQYPALPAAQRTQLDQAMAMAERDGQTLGIMPAVDKGEMYFQDGRRLYAVSLPSGGMPLAGWSQTYGGDRNGQFVLPNTWGSGRGYQQTVTLTDSAVLAVMGQPDRRAMDVGMQPQGEPRLVCLDRATGKENWVVTPSGLNVPKEAEGVRQLHLMGSPLVLGDAVLVAGRTAKTGQQFEDCWVLCFDLAGGKYRWSSYIASSSSAGAMWGVQTLGLSENATHLAYGDGRLYVMSNLGALAALDAYNGTILWLNIYPRSVSQGMDPQMGFNNWALQQVNSGGLKPWSFNPVIVHQGRLFALPVDGRFLMVYDAANGTEVKRIRLSHLDGADTVLGVFGDRLIATSENRVVCLNWKAYDAEKFSQDMFFWMGPELRFPIRGRGFVTNDSVFVPAGDRLFRYDMKSGRAIEAYPDYSRQWEKGSEGPGNVVVTSDHVVIAGDQRVDVYTDLAVAKKKLDAEIAASPRDPQPRLRYAGLLFAAGDPGGSLAKLDEAIELIGGRAGMTPGSVRDQVFNDALTFAEKLASGTVGAAAEATKERVLQTYERAAAAANSPAQQVRFRLSRSAYAEKERDAATAAKLYQEILADARLRAEPLLDDATATPTQAAAVAEKSIANLIRQAGSAVYEPFQKAAEAALAEAQKTGEPAKLLAVAQVYPNASVAPRAMLAAADAYEAAGDARGAVHVLRPMYFKYPDSPEKPRIIEAMARNYLALPNRLDTAAARLAQGSNLGGDGAMNLTRPMTLPDGKVLPQGTPFSAALEEVRKYSGREVAKTLPNFGLPQPPKGPTKADRQQKLALVKAFRAQEPLTLASGVTALVQPTRETARPDRIVAWTAGRGLTVYQPGKNDPVLTSDAAGERPDRVAWLGDDLLVWGDTQVMLLPGAGATAAPKWKLDVKTLATLEVSRLGADGAAAANGPAGNAAFIQPGGGIQVIVRGNQQFIIRNGVWQPLAPPPLAQRPAAGVEEQVTDVRPVGDRVLVSTSAGRLLSVDLAGGRITWQTRLSDRPLDRVVATEDFTVVRCSDDANIRLIALDTFTGQPLGTPKNFSPQNGLVPMNLALSADGTLVYTLPDRLVLKDLYKWNDALGERTIPGAAQQPPYTGAVRPEQLVIAEGRILALADGGPQIGLSPDKYVRLHSLETGLALPLRYKTGKGNEEVDRVLTTFNKNWDVALRVVGSHLYVIGSRAIVSYNLDRPSETWSTQGTLPTGNLRDAFIGQNFLAVLEQPEGINRDAAAAAGAAGLPGQPNLVVIPPGGIPRPGFPGQVAAGRPGEKPAEKPAQRLRLHVYGLYSVSDKNPAQSGRLDYDKELTDPAGIHTTWQAVDGGFCYLTGDGKLKMIRGAVGNQVP